MLNVYAECHYVFCHGIQKKSFGRHGNRHSDTQHDDTLGAESQISHCAACRKLANMLDVVMLSIV